MATGYKTILLLMLFLNQFVYPDWVNTRKISGEDYLCSVLNGTNIFIGTYGQGVFLSTDNGTNWTQVNDGLTNIYVWSLAVSGNNIFAGTGNGVFLSTNNGTSWKAVNNGLPGILDVHDLGVSGNNIFFSTYVQNTYSYCLFLSTNNGISWTQSNNGLPSTSNVSAFAVSGNNIFAGTGEGVFLSTNNGTSWKAVNNGMNSISVNALAVSGNNIFAGCGNSVFLSTNNGISWTQKNNGLTNHQIRCFCVIGTNILVGTEGDLSLSIDFGNNWTQVSNPWVLSIIESMVTCDNNIFAGVLVEGFWKRPISEILTSSPTITTLSPIGGEILWIGSSYNITWNSSNVSNVKIEYSTDNGNSWSTIISSILASVGSYRWAVPNNPSSNCLVRISDITSSTIISNSPSVFTIKVNPVSFQAVEFYSNVGTSTGNPKNFINPGKLIKFKLKIRNSLPNNILTGYGSIQSLTSGVSVTSNTGTFNNVLSGNDGWSVNDFEISVPNTIPFGSNIDFQLTVTQAIDPKGPWTSSFSFPVAPLKAGQILIDDDQYPDSHGNNNKIPEPGEIVEVIPLINNLSSQTLSSVKGKLESNLSGITVWDSVDGVSGKVYSSLRYNVLSGISQPIVSGAKDIQPEVDYVFSYGNISPYPSLPLDISYEGYLESGSLIKWIDNFNMTNGNVNSVKDDSKTHSAAPKYFLDQNYPNPFNPTTTINYSLPTAGHINLTIYNSIGSKVATIVDEYKPAGEYSVKFNGNNLSSGIYLYKIEAGSYNTTKKFILIK